MYPKVKVRQLQDQDDRHGHQDFCSEKEYEKISAPSVAKIPKSYIPSKALSVANDIPSVAMPKISVLQGEEEKDNKNIDEDGKQNIRASSSSIPRPRAVLSSPDNDLVIGSKNRCKTERSSVLKNRNLVQSRHAQRKVIPNTTANSINSKNSKEDPNESKGKKGSIVAGPTQRRQTRTVKPSWQDP